MLLKVIVIPMPARTHSFLGLPPVVIIFETLVALLITAGNQSISHIKNVLEQMLGCTANQGCVTDQTCVIFESNQVVCIVDLDNCSCWFGCDLDIILK